MDDTVPRNPFSADYWSTIFWGPCPFWKGLFDNSDPMCGGNPPGTTTGDLFSSAAHSLGGLKLYPELSHSQIDSLKAQNPGATNAIDVYANKFIRTGLFPDAASAVSFAGKAIVIVVLLILMLVVLEIGK
ncbi:MAG TPA: hypothetical protein VFA76_12960 [Terriglobales bacterium]|nr:hypothetical protein [Terriglobales bacterium]